MVQIGANGPPQLENFIINTFRELTFIIAFFVNLVKSTKNGKSVRADIRE